MRKHILLFFLLTFAGAAVQARAAPAPAAGASLADAPLTPAQARQALAVLHDDKKRAEVEQTLRAVAKASPASAASALPASATPATPASGASSALAHSLAANGLVAQLLVQIGRWSHVASGHARAMGTALLDFPSIAPWWSRALGTVSGRAFLLDALWNLLAVLAAGLLAQFLVTRGLARPRRLLLRRAEAADVIENREVKAAERASAAQAAEAARTDAEAGTAGTGTGDVDPAAAGMSPAPAAATAAALSSAAPTAPTAATLPTTATAATSATDPTAAPVRTPATAATVPTAPAGTPATRAALSAPAAPADPPAPPEKPALLRSHFGPLAAVHWNLLRRLPYAVLNAVLALLPIAAFTGAVALTMQSLTDAGGRFHLMILSIVEAYVITCVVMVLTRMALAPHAQALRLVRLRDASARYLEKWIWRITVVAAFGTGLANAALELGISPEAKDAFLKVAALIVHVFAAIVVVQRRNAVADVIRGDPARTGPVSAMRQWLAQIWSLVALFLIVAVWLVWALGVDDGLEKLVHFCGVAGGVLIAARVLAIVVLGALGRVFHPPGADLEHASHFDQRIARYYPLLRNATSTALWIGTVLVLLEIFHVDVLHWFAHGVIGRRLLSAIITIGIASAIAIVIWEATNLSIDRRLKRWTEQGDRLRAARLRTLVPMLRTSLFIAIALTVGLTGLNQIGVNIAPLLAGASIIGVALGFGSQKLVQDFITGIFLLMENAMQVGDWVTVAGVSGTVEYLSIRTVRLRGSDGSLHLVPFSSVTTVNNTNRGLGNASVRVCLVYGVDTDHVAQVLKDIVLGMRAEPAFGALMLSDLELWGVDQVDGATVTLAGQIRAIDSGRWAVQREFNRRVARRLRELDIPFANPNTRVVVQPPGVQGIVENEPAKNDARKDDAANGDAVKDDTPQDNTAKDDAARSEPARQTAPAHAPSPRPAPARD